MLRTHIMGAEEPEPGDLIEFFRKGYQHWAVYVGDGDVVHLTTPDIGSSGASSSVLGGSVWGQVRKDKLQDVVNEDYCRINNIHDKELKPRPTQKIVKDALSMVDKDVQYSVSDWNCEHFATWCRYGRSMSVQVLKVVGAAVVLGVGCILNPSMAVVGGLALAQQIFKGISTSTSTSTSTSRSVSHSC